MVATSLEALVLVKLGTVDIIFMASLMLDIQAIRSSHTNNSLHFRSSPLILNSQHTHSSQLTHRSNLIHSLLVIQLLINHKDMSNLKDMFNLKDMLNLKDTLSLKLTLEQHRPIKLITSLKEMLSHMDMIKIMDTLKQPKPSRIILLRPLIKLQNIRINHSLGLKATNSKRTKRSHKDSLNLRIMEMPLKHIPSHREHTQHMKNQLPLHK